MRSQPVKVKAVYSYRSAVNLKLSTLAGKTASENIRELREAWYSLQSTFTFPGIIDIGEIESCVKYRILSINSDVLCLIINKIECRVNGVNYMINLSSVRK